MSEETKMKLDRRRLIKAGAAAGVAIPAAGLLAACSSGGDSAEGGAAPATPKTQFYPSILNGVGSGGTFPGHRVE